MVRERRLDSGGSTVSETDFTYDAAGALTDTYSYTAFGELFAQTGSTVNSYLYTGQQFDDFTGVYSLRARYYDPGLGRFLSRDAAEIELSNPRELNRYVYAANSPINLADPSGLQTATERGLLGLTLTIAASPAGQVGFVAAGSLAMMYVAWLVREPVRAPARPGWPDTTNPNPGENPFGTPPQWERPPGGPSAWSKVLALLSILGAVGTSIEGSLQRQVEGEPVRERVEPRPTPTPDSGKLYRAETIDKYGFNWTWRPRGFDKGTGMSFFRSQGGLKAILRSPCRVFSILREALHPGRWPVIDDNEPPGHVSVRAVRADEWDEWHAYYNRGYPGNSQYERTLVEHPLTVELGSLATLDGLLVP